MLACMIWFPSKCFNCQQWVACKLSVNFSTLSEMSFHIPVSFLDPLSLAPEKKKKKYFLVVLKEINSRIIVLLRDKDGANAWNSALMGWQKI